MPGSWGMRLAVLAAVLAGLLAACVPAGGGGGANGDDRGGLDGAPSADRGPADDLGPAIDRGASPDGAPLDGAPLDQGQPPADGSPPDRAPPDQSLPCTDGEQRCDGRCVDPRLDPEHCGGCGVACAGDGPARLCLAGVCEAPCPAGERACAGRCVDLTSDPTHCGGCGVECLRDPVGRSRCLDGACVPLCPDGWAVCDGRCVELDTDAEHCGGCGQPCPQPDDGEAACAGGVCRALRCPPTLRACGGNCWTCPTDGVAELTCRGRQCVAAACAPGWVLSHAGACVRPRVERSGALLGLADGARDVDLAFDDRGWVVMAFAEQTSPNDLLLTLVEEPMGPGGRRTLDWGSRRRERDQEVEVAVAALPGDRQVVAWAHSNEQGPELVHGVRVVQPGDEDAGPLGTVDVAHLPGESVGALTLSAWLDDDDSPQVATTLGMPDIDQRLPYRLEGDALVAEPPLDGYGLTQRGPHGAWHDVLRVDRRGLVWRRRAPARPVVERALPAEARVPIAMSPDGPVVLHTAGRGAIWVSRWQPTGWQVDELAPDGGGGGGDVEVTDDGAAVCWVTRDAVWWASALGDWAPEQVMPIPIEEFVRECAVAVHAGGVPAVIFLVRELDTGAARWVYIGPAPE